MNKPVIQIENLSKAYQIGQIGTGTLSKDIDRFFQTKILGREDPFLKIGETNDRNTKGKSNIVWSLKDLNFEINQGDALGIIGKNGAGKSTLLKVLSRVTSPTTGTIKARGRIASLLEVGTGFHPELSGRENIYLNGAILGMRKSEITRKLDEIIDFSGVERYIDTPVKRYSSGMYVRLAFAVAAHLESEILIVDEVLAVGDAEFQKKCLGKMGDISKGEGRTILFVSHNMAAVQSLCNIAIVLEKGAAKELLPINKAVEYYLNSSVKQTVATDFSFPNIRLIAIDLISEGIKTNVFAAFQKSEIVISFEYLQPIPFECHIEIFIKNTLGIVITTLSSWLNSSNLKPQKGISIATCSLPLGFSLVAGSYIMDVRFVDNIDQMFENIVSFEIVNSVVTGYIKDTPAHHFGAIYTPNQWQI